MHVVVIGAGAAGCTAAYCLTGAGHRVTVFEAEPGAGGRIRSAQTDGFVVDTGAGFIASFYDRTLALIRELGHDGEVVRMRAPTGFHDGERTHVVRPDRPASLLGLRLIGWRDKLRLGALALRSDVRRAPGVFDLDGLVNGDHGDRAGDWARAAVGDRAYTYAIAPSIESTLCVPADEVAAVFLRAGIRHGRGARQFCLRRGIGSLCGWLLGGSELRTGARVIALESSKSGIRVELAGAEGLSADAAIVATDGISAHSLLGEGLAETPYAESVHVAIGFERDPWPGVPIGVVMPVGPGRDGIVAVASRQSRKAPGLVPRGAELVDVYLTARASSDLDDERAASAARDGAARLFGGHSEQPLFCQVYRRRAGLALPRPGHYHAMAETLRTLPPLVGLAGDCVTHAGVEAAVSSGERAARALLR